MLASSVASARVSVGMKKGEECSIPDTSHPSDVTIHSDVFTLLPSPFGGVLMIRFDLMHIMFLRIEVKFWKLGLLFSKDVSVSVRVVELILIAPYVRFVKEQPVKEWLSEFLPLTNTAPPSHKQISLYSEEEDESELYIGVFVRVWIDGEEDEEEERVVLDRVSVPYP